MRPTKVTPAMVRAIARHTAKGLTSVQIADKVGLEASTVRKLRAGTLPLNEACLLVWQQAFALPKPSSRVNNREEPASGVQKPSVGTVASTTATKPATAPISHAAKKLAQASSYLAQAVAPVPTAIDTEKEDSMLLQNATLSPEARKHFGLARNPFLDDVQSPDDVFQTPNVRYVRAALMDCAQHHGFVAVVGESGSGKTTLAEDLEERIQAEKRGVLVMRPYVLAMEANDQKGKTLKSSQIAECIAWALDPQVKTKSSPQARFQQVHDLLKASRRAGMHHLLVIEEAHCLPLATLKHLKRFLELKDGMQRLLGVALIGQPELRDRLSSQNAEVREVAQRCEVVTLAPLDNELEGYLQHKFARFELKLADVFAPDAFDAIRSRLINMPRGGKPADARSVCYPLVVNNLTCRAMNAAARAGWTQVDAQVIAGC